MSTEKNTSLAITFIAPSGLDDVDDAEDTNANITLVLDSDANASASSFSSGTPAYVRQFPPGEYTMNVNIGTVEKRLRRVPYIVSAEKVYFANAATANLTYLPQGAVSYSWIGNDLGEVTFNGRIATIGAVGVGVLSCTYVTLYDQLKITYGGSDATTVLLVVVNGDVSDSLLITYTGASEVTTRPVIITVKDYCSDEVVVGANVEVSGTGYPATNFTTNAQGQANLGSLTVGVTYNIKITATGYRDSDDDSLSNDSFIVTAES